MDKINRQAKTVGRWEDILMPIEGAMVKWFVYYTGRHGVKRCSCFEDDEQQAKHFASLVEGRVVLEVNGRVIKELKRGV